MKFKEWLDMWEANQVVNRGGASKSRYFQQNTDLPLNRAPVAVASGISSSLMQSQQQSGAEFHGTPSVPRYDSDSMDKGEILDDQGVTSASLPLQMPMIMINGAQKEIVMDPKRMRTIDNKDGDPSVDELYVVFDENNSEHEINKAVRHTKELAYKEIIRLMTQRGDINKVDPKPVQEKQYLNDGVLTVVYQFKPKKGGK
jgi:hypothetical protein